MDQWTRHAERTNRQHVRVGEQWNLSKPTGTFGQQPSDYEHQTRTQATTPDDSINHSPPSLADLNSPRIRRPNNQASFADDLARRWHTRCDCGPQPPSDPFSQETVEAVNPQHRLIYELIINAQRLHVSVCSRCLRDRL